MTQLNISLPFVTAAQVENAHYCTPDDVNTLPTNIIVFAMIRSKMHPRTYA